MSRAGSPTARGMALLGMTIFVLCGVLPGFRSGPPGFMTNAPGDANCTICHFDHSLNAGLAAGIATFDVSGPDTVLDIGAGGVAALVVSFPATTRPVHGFEMTVRDAADAPFAPSFAGSWDSTTFGSNVQYAFGDFEYVSHTLTGSNQTSWTVGWTPDGFPPAGPMTFYATGNGANGDAAPIGDYIFAATHRVYQARVSVAQTTWALGASHPITLEAPSVGGHGYILVASDDPAETPLGGPFVAPLNPFSPLALTTQDPAYGAIFQGFQGTLDSAGNATAFCNLPPLPSLSGLVAHLAFATLDPQAPFPVVSEVSNRVTVTLQ